MISDPSGNDFHQVGLTALAQKCKNFEKARKAVFNKNFVQQNRGFYGFVPRSPLPACILDKSTETNLDYLEIKN